MRAILYLEPYLARKAAIINGVLHAEHCLKRKREALVVVADEYTPQGYHWPIYLA